MPIHKLRTDGRIQALWPPYPNLKPNPDPSDGATMSYDRTNGYWTLSAEGPEPPSTSRIGWWRAGDITAADGADISSWPEASGGTALSATGTPVYHATGPGGLPYVEMASTEKMSATGLLSGKSALDLYAVIRIPTLANYYWFCGGSSDRPALGDLAKWGLGDGIRYVSGSLINSAAVSVRSWVIVRVRFKTGTSNAIVRVGGSEVTGTDSSMATLADVHLGGHNATSTEWTNLDCAELIVYDGDGTHTPADVLSYLNGKYGLTA